MHREDEAVRVLGIPGSLRRDSLNRRLLQAAAAVAPPEVGIAIWDGLKAIPPFDQDDEATPDDSVLDLRRSIADADALLVVTPEYNGSLPGQLKNALDWASRPRAETVLRDTPVAVVGASPSPGGARNAQADARRVLTRAGARVLPGELALAQAHTRFDPDGALVETATGAQLAELLAELARAARGEEQAAAA